MLAKFLESLFDGRKKDNVSWGGCNIRSKAKKGVAKLTRWCFKDKQYTGGWLVCCVIGSHMGPPTVLLWEVHFGKSSLDRVWPDLYLGTKRACLYLVNPRIQIFCTSEKVIWTLFFCNCVCPRNTKKTLTLRHFYPTASSTEPSRVRLCAGKSWGALEAFTTSPRKWSDLGHEGSNRFT